VIAARIAILAAALAAGAVCQAQAANRAATTVNTQPPAKPPAARFLPGHLCHPHYEYGPPNSQRPQSPYAIYVYYVDFQCNKTLVRVIRNPQKMVKVTR